MKNKRGILETVLVFIFPCSYNEWGQRLYYWLKIYLTKLSLACSREKQWCMLDLWRFVVFKSFQHISFSKPFWMIHLYISGWSSSWLTDLIWGIYKLTTLKIWSVSHPELSCDFRRVMWDIWTSFKKPCSLLWIAKPRNWAGINEEWQFVDELQGGQSKLLQDFKDSSSLLRSPAASLSVGDISNQRALHLDNEEKAESVFPFLPLSSSMVEV